MKRSFYSVLLIAFFCSAVSLFDFAQQNSVYGQQGAASGEEPASPKATVEGVEQYAQLLSKQERLLKLVIQLNSKIDEAYDKYDASANLLWKADIQVAKKLQEALLKNAEPEVAFAEAQQAQLEYNDLAKECHALYEEREHLRELRYKTQSALSRTASLVYKTEELFANAVAISLNEKDVYSAPVKKAIRALENEFVQKAKLKAAGNSALEKAIQDYEQAFPEVNNTYVASEAASIANHKIIVPGLWQQKHEFRQKAEEIFAKPKGSVSAKEYKEFQETGQKIAQQSEIEKKAQELSDQAYSKYSAAKEAYGKAFLAVVLLTH